MTVGKCCILSLMWTLCCYHLTQGNVETFRPLRLMKLFGIFYRRDFIKCRIVNICGISESPILLISEYLSWKTATQKTPPFLNLRLLLRFISLSNKFLWDSAFSIVLCAIAIHNLTAISAFLETHMPLSFELQRASVENRAKPMLCLADMVSMRQPGWCSPGSSTVPPAFADWPHSSCLFQALHKNRASHCLQNKDRVPQATDKLAYPCFRDTVTEPL